MSIQFVPPKRRTPSAPLDGPQLPMYEPNPLTWGRLRTTDKDALQDPRDGLRVIVHIDIDAAYAMMEAARLQIDSSVPLAVLQWDALIAVNYAAREYGISRMDRIGGALEKCPHLRLVHVATFTATDEAPVYRERPDPKKHKVSLDYYRAESRKIVGIFSEYADLVQKASVDECFLDMTSVVRQHVLQDYAPYLSLRRGESSDTDVCPEPSSLGITNLVWGSPSESSHKARLLPPPNEVNVVPPLDEGCVTWADVALATASRLVHHCRDRVRNELGYTCSAGISHNAMLAKLCSALNKPDRQTILRRPGVHAMLDPLPFRKIKNLGGKFGAMLHEASGLTTVGDLARLDFETLVDYVPDNDREQALWVWEAVHGIDNTLVTPRLATKSMVSSKNFRRPLVHMRDVLDVLPLYVRDLQFRLNDARRVTPGLWPQTIHMSYRYNTGAFSNDVRSHQMPFPKPSTISDTDVVDSMHIARPAEKLLMLIVDSQPDKEKLPGNWNVFGIQLMNFYIPDKQQNSIDAFVHRESLDPVAASRACASCSHVVKVHDTELEPDTDPAFLLDRRYQEHQDYHVAADLAASERVRIRPAQPHKRSLDSVSSNGPSAKSRAKNESSNQASLSTFFQKK